MFMKSKPQGSCISADRSGLAFDRLPRLQFQNSKTDGDTLSNLI